MHVHIHVHIHTHIHIHVHIKSHTQANTCACTRIHIHIHVHINARMCARAYIYAYASFTNKAINGRGACEQNDWVNESCHIWMSHVTYECDMTHLHVTWFYKCAYKAVNGCRPREQTALVGCAAAREAAPHSLAYDSLHGWSRGAEFAHSYYGQRYACTHIYMRTPRVWRSHVTCMEWVTSHIEHTTHSVAEAEALSSCIAIMGNGMCLCMHIFHTHTCTRAHTYTWHMCWVPGV